MAPYNFIIRGSKSQRGVEFGICDISKKIRKLQMDIRSLLPIQKKTFFPDVKAFFGFYLAPNSALKTVLYII